MLKTVDAFELERIAIELSCAVEIVGAIQSAMVKNSRTDTPISDALFGAYNYLCHLSEKISALYKE